MEKIYNKLVRDYVPNIIMSDGNIPVTRILDDDEYWGYLIKKDNDKLIEVKEALSKEERKKKLADKLEVLKAMTEYNDLTLEDIIEEADKISKKNGAFKKRILLEKIIKK